MNSPNQNFDAYAFSAQPRYDESTARTEFAKLMPLRTLVIYCFDPRATGIPAAVAEELGEDYPGEILSDADANEIGTTTTMPVLSPIRMVKSMSWGHF